MEKSSKEVSNGLASLSQIYGTYFGNIKNNLNYLIDHYLIGLSYLIGFSILFFITLSLLYFYFSPVVSKIAMRGENYYQSPEYIFPLLMGPIFLFIPISFLLTLLISSFLIPALLRIAENTLDNKREGFVDILSKYATKRFFKILLVSVYNGVLFIAAFVLMMLIMMIFSFILSFLSILLLPVFALLAFLFFLLLGFVLSLVLVKTYKQDRVDYINDVKKAYEFSKKNLGTVAKYYLFLVGLYLVIFIITSILSFIPYLYLILLPLIISYSQVIQFAPIIVYSRHVK